MRYLASIAGIYIVLRTGEVLVGRSWWWALPLAPILLVPLAPMLLGSRRHEFAADAEGVAFTRDARAYIRMLAKLSVLNDRKVSAGKSSDSMSTHPATMRRIRAVAQRAGMTEDEMNALVAEAEDAAGRMPMADASCAPVAPQSAEPAPG